MDREDTLIELTARLGELALQPLTRPTADAIARLAGQVARIAELPLPEASVHALRP